MFIRGMMLIGVFSLVAQKGCTGLDRSSLALVILQSLVTSTFQVLGQLLAGAFGTT